ncbi:MAG: transposase [Verrucomicrobiota bacterium]
MAKIELRQLPRLPRGAYQGLAMVHWIYSMNHRETGWLDEVFHLRFRELSCHVLGRYGCVVPAYCLMPDHMHLLCMGISDTSDQYLMNKMLRQELAKTLEPVAMERQPYDNVLREGERKRRVFEGTANYVLENPVRRELVEDWKAYPFSGCLVPGYFDLDPRKEGYWELFWRIRQKLVRE